MSPNQLWWERLGKSRVYDFEHLHNTKGGWEWLFKHDSGKARRSSCWVHPLRKLFKCRIWTFFFKGKASPFEISSRKWEGPTPSMVISRARRRFTNNTRPLDQHPSTVLQDMGPYLVSFIGPGLSQRTGGSWPTLGVLDSLEGLCNRIVWISWTKDFMA